MKMTENGSAVTCLPVEMKNGDLLAREGFTYCYSVNAMGDADAIYLFGGLIKQESDEEDYRETNELLLFKPSSNEVTALKASEECPSPRAGASLAISGDRIFMFGGFNHSEAWLNDFWTYQLPSGPWRKGEFTVARPSIGGSEGRPAATGGFGTPLPTPRDKATISVVTTASGTQLWLFGGFGPMPAGSLIDTKEGEDNVEDGCAEGMVVTSENEEKQDPLRLKWFDDLYCINATPNPDGLFEVKKPMQLNLETPTARAAHGSAVYMAKNGHPQVVIFGGRDTDGRTNDLSVFDTKTRKWTVYDVSDEGFEGDDDDDDDEDMEEEVEDEKELCEDETSKEKNGSSKPDEEVSDDIAEQVKRNVEAIRKKASQAELEKKETKVEPTLEQPWPDCRSYLSVCISRNQWLFVFGGRSEHDTEFNDLWMFDLENPSNGWCKLVTKSGPWPQARSGSVMVPTSSDDEHCKLLVLGGCGNLQPESMHCANLFTNSFSFDVNLEAALNMEREPVEGPDAATLLKAAKKSVMAAIKGEDADNGESAKPCKRSASPDPVEAIGEDLQNGSDATKRVRCGADN